MTTPVSAPVSPLGRALREVLGGVAAPAQAQQLVRSALLQAGLEDVPEDVERFRAFVTTALRASVERALGADAAEIVGTELAHLLHRIAPVAVRATGTDDADDLSGERSVEGSAAAHAKSSDVRSSPRARPDVAAALRPPAPRVPSVDDLAPLEAPLLFPARARTNESGTQRKGAAVARVTGDPSLRASRGGVEEVRTPAPTSHAFPARVLVVTLDPDLVRDVETEARGRTEVVAIASSAELAAALVRGTSRLAVVLDAGIPAIDAPTFARHAAALPPGTHVVLWGIGERQKARLVALYPEVARWVAGGEAQSAFALVTAE